MKLALVNLSQDLSILPQVMTAIAQALEHQLTMHYEPVWQSYGAQVLVYPSLDAVPNDGETAPVAIWDTPNDQALGWHDVLANGIGSGSIFWDPIRQAGGSLLQGPLSLSAVISHEALEMMGDPYINWWAELPNGDTEAIELCLSGDSEVLHPNGSFTPISTLAERGGFFDVVSRTSDGRTVSARGGQARRTHQNTSVLRVSFTDGTFVECTPEHKILTGDGPDYKRARELVRNERILCLPSDSSSNAVYGLFPNTEFRRENFRGLATGTDSNDLFGSEFCPPRAHSGPISVSCHSLLSRSVEHVLPMRTQEKVGRIHASRNVTRMADFQSRSERPIRHLEREAMSEETFSSHPSDANLSVTSARKRSRPQPACFRLLDFAPETLFRCRPPTVEPAISGVRRSELPNAMIVRRTHAFGPVGTRATFDRTKLHPLKVVDRIQYVDKRSVYDLTVPKLRNFALRSGVFVHNCDRTQGDHYDVLGVTMSNFLGPRAFREGIGPYDYMQVLKSPWELRPGGYVIRRRPDGTTYNLWGDDVPAWRRELIATTGRYARKRVGREALGKVPVLSLT